jgi:hypothetical protein
VHKLTFFSIGCADTVLIDLENRRKMLIDFADMRDPNDNSDLRINLSEYLSNDLKVAKRSDYDVVAFTHLDEDHSKKASEFFHLDHAAKYQGSGRIKIKELWVPAAAIIEEGCDGDAKILRAEARHRLREGKNIRVFSRPIRLKESLEKEKLTLESRAHLITDAGQIVPGFTDKNDQVEFFVHSPFASRLNEQDVIDRNSDALVLHATFRVEQMLTRAFFGTDIDCNDLDEIIRITRLKKREERLDSDIVKLPHHCSYKSIGPEKGKDKTEPTENVDYFYAKKLQMYGTMISTSHPIPKIDTDLPPHRQAAAYYEDKRQAVKGEFKVTMEHPTPTKPEPLVIEISASKASLKKPFASGAAFVTSNKSPRAGGRPLVL